MLIVESKIVQKSRASLKADHVSIWPMPPNWPTHHWPLPVSFWCENMTPPLCDADGKNGENIYPPAAVSQTYWILSSFGQKTWGGFVLFCCQICFLHTPTIHFCMCAYSEEFWFVNPWGGGGCNTYLEVWRKANTSCLRLTIAGVQQEVKTSNMRQLIL